MADGGQLRVYINGTEIPIKTGTGDFKSMGKIITTEVAQNGVIATTVENTAKSFACDILNKNISEETLDTINGDNGPFRLVAENSTYKYTMRNAEVTGDQTEETHSASITGFECSCSASDYTRKKIGE